MWGTRISSQVVDSFYLLLSLMWMTQNWLSSTLVKWFPVLNYLSFLRGELWWPAKTAEIYWLLSVLSPAALKWYPRTLLNQDRNYIFVAKISVPLYICLSLISGSLVSTGSLLNMLFWTPEAGKLNPIAFIPVCLWCLGDGIILTQINGEICTNIYTNHYVN